MFLDPETSSLSKLSVHQQPSTISDLSKYTFKLLTADSLKGNENILHEFIQSQLKAEYENSESTLSITFEMVLHYLNSNASFASFIKLVESNAISFKDKLLEKIKREPHFKQLSVTKQEKLVADYYNRARSFIGKIGTQLYSFLKDYYIASKKNKFDFFFCQYSFMTTNTSILSADMIKLVIDKVYKEDFILIEAQKRSGLLSIAQNGVLGSVLQNEEVKSYFKAGQYEEMHNLIQTQVQSHGNSFSLPKKKKDHIHRILTELTSEENPFPSYKYEDSSLNITDTVKANDNQKQKTTGSSKETPSSMKIESSKVTDNEMCYSQQEVFMHQQINTIISSVEQFIISNPSALHSENKFLCGTLQCLNKFFSISDLQTAIRNIESNVSYQSVFLNEDVELPICSTSDKAIIGTPDLNNKTVVATSNKTCTADSDLNTSIESGTSSLGFSPSRSPKDQFTSVMASEDHSAAKKDKTCTAYSDMNTSMESGTSSLDFLSFHSPNDLDEKKRTLDDEELDKNGILTLEGDGRVDHGLSDYFYNSLVNENGGVRIINVTCGDDGLDNLKRESSYLISAILTMFMHSIRLLRLAEEKVTDWKSFRWLMKIIQELDTDFGTTPWTYDIVLQKLSLNPVSFSHQNFSGSSFDFGKCLDSFISSNSLCSKGLRCVGTIDLVSCKDLNSFHAKLEALYQQSLINDPTSKDKALTFVSVNRNHGSEELSLKALSHAFIIKTKKTETCLQLFAAVYSTITGRLKVVLVTRSVFTSVLDSDYFIYEYDIPNDNSNTARLERVNSPSRCSDSRILTVLPGGYSLSGLVYGQTLSQINSAKKNQNCLTRELYRINDFARYGKEAMDILLSSEVWLNDSIINSIFGLVCRSYNETSKDASTSQIVLSCEFITWLLANNETSIKKFGPTIDINDSSLNTVVHIPVNYPSRKHWIYILLHVQKKTIYYMDSLPNTKNGAFVGGKLNEFIESEYNTKQSSSNAIRRKDFVKWAIKQIQCPIQPDGDNCGVYTIMNMVRTSQNIKENRYLNSSNLFTNHNITSANLNKGRQIIKEIMFESASVEKLLNFVNDVYFCK